MKITSFGKFGRRGMLQGKSAAASEIASSGRFGRQTMLQGKLAAASEIASSGRYGRLAVIALILVFIVAAAAGCGGEKSGVNPGGGDTAIADSGQKTTGDSTTEDSTEGDSTAGGSTENSTTGNSVIDITGLAMDLVSGVEFKDQLSSMSEQAFYALYAIEPSDVTGFAVYAGTGATAEEVAVIEAADENSADAVEEAVLGRVIAQRDGFENYVPEELIKLKDPVLVRNGNYVILCVSDDNDGAGEIIGEYFK